MSQTPVLPQPLKWDILEKDTDHVTLNWLSQQWTTEKGRSMSIKGLRFGNDGSLKWSNILTGAGLYSAINIAFTSQGLTIPLIVNCLSFSICMSIKPAVSGSPRAWRHARAGGQSPLKAFGAVVSRIGHKFKAVATPNVLEPVYLAVIAGFFGARYAASQFKKIGAEKLSAKVSAIEGQWAVKALDFEKKAQQIERWKAGQLIQVSALEGLGPSQALELYSDWMKVAFKHRWCRAESLLGQMMINSENAKAHQLEKDMNQAFELISKKALAPNFATPEEIDAEKNAWVKAHTEAAASELASLPDRVAAFKMKTAPELGMKVQELELKQQMDSFLNRVKQEPLSYDVLFQRTKASGIKSHFKPQDGMPSLMEVIEMAFHDHPAAEMFKDRLGEFRSLGEADLLKGVVGEVSHEKAGLKISKARL